MGELTVSVTQLNSYIKNIFDAEELLKNIKVVGEITNLKRSGSAIYFDLKDESASIPCVAFNSSIMDGFEFGDNVVLKGSPNFYVKGGRLSFVVSKIEKYGIGELYKEYLETKARLEKEGLFDELHKKPLPKFVKRVGVVTSKTGAVIRDIIRVKRSKNHCSDIVLFPAKVQGIGAAEEIINGIRVLDDYGVDVIIVARGGGSFEDYQPFNTESVVRAVYNAKTPIVSAIGHENDWSLIDFAADVRAATPSVASEIVFFDELQFLSSIMAPLSSYIDGLDLAIKQNQEKLLKSMNLVNYTISRRLKSDAGSIIKAGKRLINSTENLLEMKKMQLKVASKTIEGNNPKAILDRGYAKILADGKPIKSIKNLSINECVEIDLLDGYAKATILEVKEKK